MEMFSQANSETHSEISEHFQFPEICTLCANPNSACFRFPWHYRPRAKHRFKYNEQDSWQLLDVMLCKGCSLSLEPGCIPFWNENSNPTEQNIHDFALKHSFYLVGWDFWDAVDGVDVALSSYASKLAEKESTIILPFE